MDWIVKLLFGEGEDAKDSLTKEDVTAALKGKKLVDLADGKHVGKEKFEALEAKLKELQTAHDELKAAGDGDEKLRKQLADAERDLAAAVKRAEDAEADAQAKAEGLTLAERREKVAEKAGHLSPKMRRLLLEDATRLVTDELPFEDALAKAIADDADYAPPAEDDDDAEHKAPAKVGVGAPAGGKPEKKDPAIAAIDKAFDDGKESTKE